ncbi:MAG: hypothetical protein ACT4P9_09925 [Betaproteobacteria bacterium]
MVGVQSGRMTVLQAALYVALVSVMALVLLDRSQVYFAMAERATVDVTLNSTRSALNLRLAYERMQGLLSRERQWDGGNPFDLGRMKVENYAGELDGPGALAGLRTGSWAFDRRKGELVYRPGYPRGLSVDDGAALLRFRLIVPGPGAVPRLDPVVPYIWSP